MIGSHRFMTFRPNDGRIDTAWIAWFFLTEPGLELIRRASPGSAGRNRTLAIERFEALEIPLPPIDEQRRVARYLDATADASSTVAQLTRRAQELSGALAVSLRPVLISMNESDEAPGGRSSTSTPSWCKRTTRSRSAPDGVYPNLGILQLRARTLREVGHRWVRDLGHSRLNRYEAVNVVLQQALGVGGRRTPSCRRSSTASSSRTSFRRSTRIPIGSNARCLSERHAIDRAGGPSYTGASKGLGVATRAGARRSRSSSHRIWLPPIETQTVDGCERSTDSSRSRPARVDAERRTAAWSLQR